MSYIGQNPVFGDFPYQTLTGDGTSSYTLNFNISNENGILVFLNGAVQRPGVDYTAGGTSLQFADNVTLGTQIFVYGMGLPKSMLSTSMGGVGEQELSASLSSNIAGTSFSNLKLSASGIDSNVSITADLISLRPATGVQKVVFDVSLSVNSSAVGVNGLDTGTLAASTWYSVWVISNGATTAGLLSLSATAPTLPSGYTHKARVGWIRTDGTANKYPLGFKQSGGRVQYFVSAGTNLTSAPVMASGVAGGVANSLVPVSIANFVPPTAISINVQAQATATQSVQVCSNSTAAPNDGAGWLYAASSVGQINTASSVFIESNSIYWASSAAGGVLTAFGWEDNL